MGIRRPTPDANSYYEDDDDDIAPVVRKARREDDAPPEEDRPARRRAVRSDDEEPDHRARRRPDPEPDEDDDPAPPRSVQRRAGQRGVKLPRQRERTEDDFEPEDEDDQATTNSRVAAGWGAAKTLQSEGGDFNAEFKLTEDPTLVKFLGDEPFAVYKQHFLREREQGKKSFICLGNGCPLCDDLGHTPDKKFAFTVVDLTQSTFGASQLVAGPKLLRILETNNGGKNGPLSLHYWEISRTGQGLKTDYTMSIVKSRYLQEDYDLDPKIVERSLAKIKAFSVADIKEHSKAELRLIVDELDA